MARSVIVVLIFCYFTAFSNPLKYHSHPDGFCDFESGMCDIEVGGGTGSFQFSIKTGNEAAPDIPEDFMYNPEGHFLFAKSQGKVTIITIWILDMDHLHIKISLIALHICASFHVGHTRFLVHICRSC